MGPANIASIAILSVRTNESWLRMTRQIRAVFCVAVAVGGVPLAMAGDTAPQDALAESARTQSYGHRLRFFFILKRAPTFAKLHEAHGCFTRWDSLVRAEVSITPEDKKKQPIEFLSVINADQWLRAINPTSPDCRRMGAKASDERLAQELMNPETTGPLDGYFGTGSDGIATAMKKGEQLAEGPPEAVFGKTCRVLSAKTKYGQAKVWLSTSERMLLRKASLTKGQDDIFEEQKTIAAMNAASPSKEGSEYWIRQFDVSMEVRETTEIDGKIVAVSGTWKSSLTGGDGSHRDNNIEYVRSDIHLLSTQPSPATFEIVVPDGAAVSNVDDLRSEKEYEWRGGRIQPVGSNSVKNAESGGLHTRTVLWVLLAILFAAAGLAAWKLRRGRVSSR